MKILDIPRSGSYAGVVSSHNRAGQYVRNRRTTTNSPTARRTFIRGAVAAASSGFSSLTDAQRAAWTAAADSHPITDRLGSAIKLTGHQLYVSINTQRLNVGAGTSATPPSSFSVGSLGGTMGVFSLVSGLTLTIASTLTSADYQLIALSRPVPAGRSFWATYSQTDSQAGDAASYALATSAYSALFGTPAVGQKVFVRLTPVSTDGVKGVNTVFAIVVAA